MRRQQKKHRERSKTPPPRETILSYKTSDCYTPNKEFVENIKVALRRTRFDWGKRYDERYLLDTMNDIAKRVDWPYPIYRAAPHLRIFKYLLEVTTKLENNAWNGSDGAATCTLVGARGMGKSGSLRRFVEICGTLFPNVVPVYISYNKVSTSDMCETRFSELLRGELHKVGVDPDPTVYNKTDSMMTRIFRGLEKANKYAFIVIDELDKLYKTGSGSADKALQHLDEIRTLGGPTSGRVYTVLCGSSSQIYGLISKKAIHVSTETFPLYPRAQDFNGNKFHSFSVTPTLPNDISTVGTMEKTSDICEQRFIGYYTGCNARKIDTFSLYSKPPPSFPTNNPFLKGLKRRLAQKNSALLKRLHNGGKDAIRTLDWEVQLQPLNSGEVDSVWKSLDPSWNSKTDLEHELIALTDKSEIVYDPELKELHCTSLFNLCSHYRHEVLLAPWRYIQWKQFILEHYRKLFAVAMVSCACIAGLLWWKGHINSAQFSMLISLVSESVNYS
jgi:hypothetical protein